jgi:hypothetical protein
MLPRFLVLMGLGLAAVATAGCTSPVEEEQIQVNAASDPLAQPRSILENYAQGQPLGSEATSFGYLVQEVRKTDPQKADVLEQGFREIEQAAPASRAAKAKEVLNKLGSSAT